MDQIITDSKSISKLLDMLIFLDKNNLLKFKELDFELGNPDNIENFDGFLITPWGKVGLHDPHDEMQVDEFIDSVTTSVTLDFTIEVGNALYIVTLAGTVSNKRYDDPPDLNSVHSIYKVKGKNESVLIRLNRLIL